MTGSDIFAYFKKQTEEIEKNLFRAVIIHEELPIHDLRVAIKRLRALFKFLIEQHIIRPDTKYYMSRLDKIYTPLGHIRDIQLKSGFIRAFKLEGQEYFLGYQKALDKLLNLNRYKLRVFLRGFSYSEFLHFKKHKPFHPVRGVRLNQQQIIFERLIKIKRHMRHDNIDGHLHQIRKRLKEIYYCMEMSNLEKLQLKSVSLKLKKIRKMEDTIGLWHDIYLFEQTLDPENPAYIHLDSSESQQILRDEIREQNHMRFDLILEQLSPYQSIEA